MPVHIPIDFRLALSAVKLWPVGAKVVMLKVNCDAGLLLGSIRMSPWQAPTVAKNTSVSIDGRLMFHLNGQRRCGGLPRFSDWVRSAYEQGRMGEITIRPG